MLALKLDRKNETHDTISKFSQYIFMRYNFIHPNELRLFFIVD